MPDLNHTNLQEKTAELSLYLEEHIESLSSLQAQSEGLRAMLPNASDELKAQIQHKLDRLDSLTQIFNGHNQLKQRLEAIDRLIKPLNTADRNGVLPDVTKEQKQEILAAYDEAFRAAQEMRNSIRDAQTLADPGTSDCLKGLLGLSSSLGDVMARDMQMLHHYDPEKKPCPMMLITELARVHTVDLGQREIETVGNAMSERLPFSFRDSMGNLHKGFFTPQRNFNLDLGFDTLTKELKDKRHPLTPVLEGLEGHIRKNMPGAVGLVEGLSPDAAHKSLIFFAMRSCAQNRTLNPGQIGELLTQCAQEVSPELFTGDRAIETRKQIQALSGRMATLFTPNYQKNSVHMTDRRLHGNRIDSRNAAMSVMADLLGRPELLARSVPMRILRNGVLIKGTFMESAVGMDPMHPGPEEHRYSAKHMNKSPGLRDLADLQIIDFLCANTDRHGGNMFYKFEKSTDGQDRPIFQGVQGIDNDNSFGLLYMSDRTQGSGYLPAWNNMRVMSQSMVNTVQALEPRMFGLMLHGLDLAPREIEAAMIRLHNLQKNLQEDLTYFDNLRTTCEALEQKRQSQALSPEEAKQLKDGRDILAHRVLPPDRVSIIPDDKFNTLTLDQLIPKQIKGQPEKRTIFARAANFESLNMGLGDRPPESINIPSSSRIGTNAINRDVNLSWNAMLDMVEHTKEGKKVSPQYKALQDGIEDFMTFSEEHNAAPMNREYLAERNARLNNLCTLAQEYLDFKKTDGPHSLYARSRIALVTKIQKDCREAIIEPTAEELKTMDYYAPLQKSLSHKLLGEKLKAAQESLRSSNAPQGEAPRKRSGSISVKPAKTETRKRSNSISH